jgi:selenocysteine-specific elongation factor
MRSRATTCPMTEPAAPANDGGSSISVVATAGHVDHGKSSLILRMTGMDPDRLEEEKRRGLTIELGYAWCTLPSGREVGFVDVPGHERFVRTMLAGVGPVRLVLFVVAADEGWRRQSQEHLDIVDVLGVDGAVVALTKRDLVGPDRLDESEREVRERLRGTALEGIPIVACSSRSGEGLDELVGALDTMLGRAPAPERHARPRQFVDRVFTIKGSGTVVTGTLTGGPIAVGNEVELLPSGERARVRTLQTHHRRVEIAHPVSRVAANLAGTSREGIGRGEVLAHPGDWRATAVVEARIRPVRSLARPMTARGAFKLHAGSAERDARVRPYEVDEVPAAGAFARIRLSSPLVLDVGDRFVLRESGRRETVAGGVVLDADPPRRPGARAIERLERRGRTGAEDLPALLISERGAVRASDLRILTGRSPAEIPGASLAGGWWIGDTLRDAITDALERRLAAFHAAEPHAAGEELAPIRPAVSRLLRSNGVPSDADLVDAVLGSAIDTGRLVREGAAVRLGSYAPAVASDDQLALIEAVRSGEPTPPTIVELGRRGFQRSLVDSVVRSGELVRISPDLVVTAGLVRHAEECVREAGDAGITVSALRERLGTSRKYAVPLMEHMDRSGATRRSGDLRFSRRP